MSHAANLRHRHHSSTAPAKRRKLSSDSTRPHVNGDNDAPNGILGKKLEAKPPRDAKAQARAKVEEITATIGRGDEDVEMKGALNGIIDISSAEEQDSSDEDEDEEENEVANKDDARGGREEQEAFPASEALPQDNVAAEQNNVADHEQENGDDADPDEEMETFGDLVEKQKAQTKYIDATTQEDQDASKDLVAPQNRTLSVPSATSLGTVLTQALRTDDAELLESCLQIPNLESIRATIERLHSSLATNLLHKLAERMHRRPGRAGSLMVWVQWTIVAHGGYLASQPAAMKQLQTLYQVVKQRATSLQPLLALKGKLDMLEAQLQLRRNRQVAPSRSGEIDQGVVYVEGEESDSEVEDAKVADSKLQASLPQRNRKRPFPSPSPDADLGNEEDMDLLANGISEEDDEDGVDDDEAAEDSDDNLIDDEADVASADSDELPSDEVDYSSAEEASSDDDVPSPRKAATSRPRK